MQFDSLEGLGEKKRKDENRREISQRIKLGLVFSKRISLFDPLHKLPVNSNEQALSLQTAITTFAEVVQSL